MRFQELDKIALSRRERSHTMRFAESRRQRVSRNSDEDESPQTERFRQESLVAHV